MSASFLRKSFKSSSPQSKSGRREAEVNGIGYGREEVLFVSIEEGEGAAHGFDAFFCVKVGFLQYSSNSSASFPSSMSPYSIGLAICIASFLSSPIYFMWIFSFSAGLSVWHSGMVIFSVRFVCSVSRKTGTVISGDGVVNHHRN